MLKERIQDYFNNHPNLRVLFFFDPEEAYLEEVKQLEFSDIIVKHYNNTPFTTKYELVCELKTEKVFLYLPMASPQNQEAYHNFPLMGLLLANKELQLDNVGEFMERYGLQRHQKNLVGRYISELKYSGVQKVCEPLLSASQINETALQRGLLSAFLKFKQIESWSILIAKLMILAAKEDPAELNRVLKKVAALNFMDEVAKRIKECVGYPISEVNQQTLVQAAQSVLYNNITQEIAKKDKDPYKGLKIEDVTQITQLNQLLFEVDRHPTIAKAFKSLLLQMEQYIKGESLIEVYGSDAEFTEYTPTMVWEIVAQTQGHLQDNPKEVISQLERIVLQQELNENTTKALKYLHFVGRLHQHIKAIDSYVLNTPESYVQQYTEQWFGIDKVYRLALSTYKNLDTTEIPGKVKLEEIHSQLNAAYEKHTETLNREWLACLHQFKFDYQKIQVPKQYDFYNTEIAKQDQKVVVIISDALRYEVGEQLLSELHTDKQNTAEMRYMLASIPSKTNIGMAQLLPRKTVQFNDGAIKINNIDNAGIPNRAKILQEVNAEAIAYSYENIEGLNQQELRAIFKSPLVYVYHDVIDDTGDKKRSERRTFEVAKDAINELKQFIKKLHSSYNVAKVFVTADHGFLYNDREIQEKEKEPLPKVDLVQSHNRYYLTQESLTPDLGYCIPLSATTIFQENLFVTIPAATNRYKKQGVGHQFVHGGGSLQELVVPLIESSRKREEVTKKVTPVLVHKGTLRIVSNILRINVLQENEVSRFEKERIIKLGLYKDSALVSNEVELVLNATSESPSERMTRIELTLSSEAANESLLKLKVTDVEDPLNPIIAERVQNSTIIPTDF